MKRTDLPELRTWDELPVWAALMIVTTAKGLIRPGYFVGWEWSTHERDVILIHSNEFRFIARRGAPWIV